MRAIFIASRRSRTFLALFTAATAAAAAAAAAAADKMQLKHSIHTVPRVYYLHIRSIACDAVDVVIML